MLKEKILNWAKPWVEVPVAGLDISDRSVKYLKFRSNASYEVEFFGQWALPEGIIVGGEIRREDDLIAILKQLLSREGGGLRSCFIAASLPEEKSFLRLIQLPKVDRDKVGIAVQREIEANVPLPAEELIFDQEVIDPPEDHFDHLDIIITAFPKGVVESYARVLKRAGLMPAVLELESQAVARATGSNLRPHSAEIIVDIGKTRAGIAVISGGAIIFTETIALGGVIFESNIARVLNISPEKAVVIKKETGLDRQAYEGKVFFALVPACAALADEIKQARSFYEDHAKHAHGVNPAIGAVFLSGGDANMRGLATYLSSALKVPVSLSEPFAPFLEKSFYPVPAISKSQSLAYAGAIGLALRAVN